MKITEFKLAELKAACKSAGAKGYTALSKSELIDWIAASPRSADILAALPGATTFTELVEEKSPIDESKKQEIEDGSTSETPSNSSCMDEKSGMDEDEIGEFYQFGAEGEIRKGQGLSSFLSETSLQDFFPGCVVDVEEVAIAGECMDENFGVSPGNLCQALNENFQKQGLTATEKNQDLISITFQGEEFLANRKPCDPSDWYISSEGDCISPISLRLQTVRDALYRILRIFWDAEESAQMEFKPRPCTEQEAIDSAIKYLGDSPVDSAIGPSECMDKNFMEEGTDPDAGVKSKRINQILSLSSRLGAEAEGVCRKITGKSLTFCSTKELEIVLGRLIQLSALVGTDDSEPIPEDELSEDEKAANAYGAQFVADFLEGGEASAGECMEGKLHPPPQHLRDRAVAIFETSPPDGTGFVPSNGTIGDIWESLWCEKCTKFTETGCPIYVEALAGEPPAEWIYWDGAPLCTGFQEGIPPEEPIAPPPPPEASTACPIFYPGDIVCRFIEPYIVVGPDKGSQGNWLVRSQAFPEGGEFSMCLTWAHLRANSKAYPFPQEPQSLFSQWNLAIENSHKIRLMEGWENRDIAARLQDTGFQFANRIWDFCEFESYEALFSEFVTCGNWVIGRSGCAIVACFDPNLFIWQIESQDLDFWVNQIKSWQSDWNEPVILNPKKSLLAKATA